MDAVLELLTKGREFFAAHEWNRDGAYYRYGADGQIKSCCAEGALLLAGEVDEASIDGGVFEKARKLLARALPSPDLYGVYQFNDYFAKSRDDILAVFDRAIAARRSE